jgi:rhodanese-related sulfurtransferase
MTDLSVHDVHEKHEAGDHFVLLDVREPHEIVTASIPWALTIPMRDVPARLAELPTDKPIAVLCHHGGRSAQVTGYLNANGFPQAANIDGGIDAWSLHIDPTVPRY